MIRPALGNIIFTGFCALAFLIAFAALSRWAATSSVTPIAGLGRAGITILNLAEPQAA